MIESRPFAIFFLLATFVLSATFTAHAAPGDLLDAAALRVPSGPLGQGGGQTAQAGDGDYVVVWGDIQSVEGDPSRSTINIFGRAFEVGGTPRGPQFLLTETTETRPFSPRVAIAADGSFAVVWVLRPDGSNEQRIMLRYFTADGTPRGPAKTVKTIHSGLAILRADLAMAADGRTAVLWARTVRGDLGRSLFKVQRFHADGARDGLPIRVAGRLRIELGIPLGRPISFPPYLEVSTGIDAPEIAMDDNGDFVVTWVGRTTAGTTQVRDRFTRTIYAQRFPADALFPQPRRTIDRVSFITESGQFRPNLFDIDPQVAITPNGEEYVVSWREPGTADDVSPALNFRRIGGGSGAVVNVASAPFAPKLEISDDGRVALAYLLPRPDNVVARIYGPNDAALTPEIPVDGELIGDGVGSITSDANGVFLVTFDDADQDNDVAENSIYTRRVAGQ